MGFTADTAVTANSDFLKYAFDQQVTNLLRDSNTYAELHKGAVNLLIRDLRGKGYDPSVITNTTDFLAELVYWVLWQIFDGQARNGNDKAARSAEKYELKWREQVKTRVYVTSDDSKTRGPKGLPMTLNPDGGAFWGPHIPAGEGARIGSSSTFPGIDEILFQNPS